MWLRPWSPGEDAAAWLVPSLPAAASALFQLQSFVCGLLSRTGFSSCLVTRAPRTPGGVGALKPDRMAVLGSVCWKGGSEEGSEPNWLGMLLEVSYGSIGTLLGLLYTAPLMHVHHYI